MMKKWLFVPGYFAVTLALSPLWADTIVPELNQITLQLHAEQWVTTTTALVDVSINAAVTGQGIEKVRADVMAKLNTLAKGDWHLTDFNRQLDKSGLENVQISAEARLPQAALSDLRQTAKNISKPGETFTIDNITFSPSQDELTQANQALRANIYDQAKAELNTVNSRYPDQKYAIHTINFNPPPLIAPMPMMAPTMNAMAVGSTRAQSAPPLNIGNKLTLDATVSLASVVPMPNNQVMSNPIPPSNNKT